MKRQSDTGNVGKEKQSFNLRNSEPVSIGRVSTAESLSKQTNRPL